MIGTGNHMSWEIVGTGGLSYLSWSPHLPGDHHLSCKQALSVYLPSQRRLSKLKKFPQLFCIVQEGKTFEESVTTSNCDATRHNGNWYKLSFEELQTGQWLVHVRIVCVSLHQLILGSMNKQSCNSISLVISQLKNVDIFVNKFFPFSCPPPASPI